jgi:hypothetical protein
VSQPQLGAPKGSSSSSSSSRFETAGAATAACNQRIAISILGVAINKTNCTSRDKAQQQQQQQQPWSMSNTSNSQWQQKMVCAGKWLHHTVTGGQSQLASTA